MGFNKLMNAGKSCEIGSLWLGFLESLRISG